MDFPVYVNPTVTCQTFSSFPCFFYWQQSAPPERIKMLLKQTNRLYTLIKLRNIYWKSAEVIDVKYHKQETKASV